ncbi:uncharacterized protein IL334_001083 [Kwoniella shivajii]|uniref:Uncharacterized protein n=1 Tax=Kwoniella shivajii TaxID=564305 RepID=A0ABZ1CS14_9TREE|nr:hypothetical protein IL334_001083 [Kwoniella shivajii]
MLHSFSHLPSTLVLLLGILTSFGTANGRVIRKDNRRLPRGEDILTFGSFEDLVAHHNAVIVDVTVAAEVYNNSTATDPTNDAETANYTVTKRANEVETIGNLHEYTWDWVTKTCVAITVSTATLAVSSGFLLIALKNYRKMAAIVTGDGVNPATLPPAGGGRGRRDIDSSSNVTYARVETEFVIDDVKRTTHPIQLLYSIDNDNGLIQLDQAYVDLGVTSGQGNELKKRVDESHEIGVGFDGPVIQFNGNEGYYKSTQETFLRQIFNTGSEGCKQDFACGPQGCMGMAIQASSYYGFNVRNLWGGCYGVSRDWIN